MLAHQEAVVGGEEVCVLEFSFRLELLHHALNEVVEGREQSAMPAVHAVYVGLLVRAQRRESTDPVRFVRDVRLVEGRQTRGLHVFEESFVARGGWTGAVRRAWGEVHEEWLVLTV